MSQYLSFEELLMVHVFLLIKMVGIAKLAFNRGMQGKEVKGSRISHNRSELIPHVNRRYVLLCLLVGAF